MRYAPAVKSANPIETRQLGDGHTAVLLDDIVSAGSVKYAFLLVLFDDATQEPVLFVASEVNRLAKLGGGSHFLGVFDGNGHANMGVSDDWSDPDKFLTKAMNIAENWIETRRTGGNA